MNSKIVLLIIFILLIPVFFIDAQYNGKDFKSGELYSSEVVLFGKFELRARLVSTKGVVSSFFLYDNVSWKGKPNPWREIDFESIGKNKNSLQTNIITGYSDKRITSEKVDLIENLDTEFHTYTIEWTPDYVAWLVDNKLIRKDTAEKSQQVIDLRDTPQTYRMNLWIAQWEDWVGKFDKKCLPVHQFVHWVKYYEYTPGKGENKSNFTLKWIDDFDTFDNIKWGKGDWSFDGNLVDFSKTNITVKESCLILSLTTKEKMGFKGKMVKINK